MTKDTRLFKVVVDFKNGRTMEGTCIGNPIATTPIDHHGVFDHPFFFLDTDLYGPMRRESDTGYRAMIRTEDVAVISVKQIKKVDQ